MPYNIALNETTALEWIRVLSPILKSSAATILLVLAFVFVRRRDFRGFTGGMLAFSVLLYVLAAAFRGPEARHIALLPVRLGASTVAFWFYLFSRSLFADRYRPPGWTWLIPVAQLLLSLAGWLAYVAHASDRITATDADLLQDAPVLVLQLLSLGLIVAATAFVHAEGAGDLLEDRRRLRRRFIFIVAGYALLVTAVEIYLHGQCPPELLDLINTTGILSIASLLAIYTLSFQPGFLSLPRSRPTPPASPQDEALEMKVLRFIREQEGYREEALTIRRLAALLNEREYRLRLLINQRLGFRNFNDFLNRYRIEAAMNVLADPTRPAVPILRLAMDLGYGSLATFNRAFRAQTGKTPTEFRREVPGDVDLPPLPVDGS
jgi:AraC-like DNA-binding protein